MLRSPNRPTIFHRLGSMFVLGEHFTTVEAPVGKPDDVRGAQGKGMD